jgi:hypothetical protein
MDTHQKSEWVSGVGGIMVEDRKIVGSITGRVEF